VTGKGDTPRPLSVPPETFTGNWQKAFGPAIDDAVGYDPNHYTPLTDKPVRETLGDPEE
jgi:hypothetical protein